MIIPISLLFNRFSTVRYICQIIRYSVVIVIYNKRTVGFDGNSFCRRRNEVSKALYGRRNACIGRTGEILSRFQHISIVICVLLIMIYNVGNIGFRCPFCRKSDVFRSQPSTAWILNIATEPASKSIACSRRSRKCVAFVVGYGFGCVRTSSTVSIKCYRVLILDPCSRQRSISINLPIP